PSAKRGLPLRVRTVATPFIFRQRPEPYAFRNRARSRLALPKPIVSTRLILLTISNVTFANQLNLWRSRKTPSIPSPFGELITFTFLLDTEEPLMLRSEERRVGKER